MSIFMTQYFSAFETIFLVYLPPKSLNQSQLRNIALYTFFSSVYIVAPHNNSLTKLKIVIGKKKKKSQLVFLKTPTGT